MMYREPLRPPAHSALHPLAEQIHETTVALPHRLSSDSPLDSHPAASPENSVRFGLLPIPVSQVPVDQNPPTMPASTSPARASLHELSSHSLRGMSPLHSA